MICTLPWTHYTEDHPVPGYVHAFAIESCETCGHPVEAANAIGVAYRDANHHGMTRMERRLPEQYYDEDSGMCRCTDCLD